MLKRFPGLLGSLILGVLLGVMAKYLDTVAVDGSWRTTVLHYLADTFTRLGVWVLTATLIAAYGRTMYRAALHTFLFFSGMLISYYVYSSYLFGFFPTSYFLQWGVSALLSPLAAIVVWHAKNNGRLAYILPALPMGLMLTLALGIGRFYVHVNYLDELFFYLVLCVIFYKNPKQAASSIVLSFIVAILLAETHLFVF